MSETCILCGVVFGADDPQRFGERQVCRATMSSPAEYEDVGPICDLCWDAPDRDAAYERAAAHARDDDFAETNGQDWT